MRKKNIINNGSKKMRYKKNIKQKYNKNKKCWEKFKMTKDGKIKVIDIKTKKPNIPFKGILKK